MSDAPLHESTLIVQYASRFPEEFTNSLKAVEAQQTLDLLSRLPEQVLPAVLIHLPRNLAEAFLAACADTTLVNWLNDSPLIQAVRIAHRIEPARRARLSSLLATRRRTQLNRYQEFAEGTLGALVDAEYAWIYDSASVEEAVDRLRGQPTESDAPLLVLDASDLFLGLLDSRRALLLGPKSRVRECLVPTRSFPASTKLQTLLARPDVHQQAWLPVVDDHRRPIGLVPYAKLVGLPSEDSESPDNDFAVLATLMLDVLAELPVVSGAHTDAR